MSQAITSKKITLQRLPPGKRLPVVKDRFSSQSTSWEVMGAYESKQECEELERDMRELAASFLRPGAIFQLHKAIPTDYGDTGAMRLKFDLCDQSRVGINLILTFERWVPDIPSGFSRKYCKVPE